MKLRLLWCRFAHSGAMWPVHGKYTCKKCGLTHRVNWDEWPE